MTIVKLQNKNELISPLHRSWESYKNNRNNGNNNNGGKPNPTSKTDPVVATHLNPREMATSHQSATVVEERPPLHQLNQQQQQHPPSLSQKNERQSEPRRQDDEVVVVVEPMTFEGVAHRKADSVDVNYVRLVSFCVSNTFPKTLWIIFYVLPFCFIFCISTIL